MFRRIGCIILLGVCLICGSGCALIGTAISAGMAYGIYQATKK